MSGWELAVSVIVGVLVVATVVLSVLRPASRISFGVFFERQINGEKRKDVPPDEREDK